MEEVFPVRQTNRLSTFGWDSGEDSDGIGEPEKREREQPVGVALLSCPAELPLLSCRSELPSPRS
jgi:hypothetical protein